MNYVLLTSTTYGTWLPGDPRGSVTSVRDYRPSDPKTRFRVEHDRVGEGWEPSIPALYASAVRQLKQAPVLLECSDARTVVECFRETAGCRGWRLSAVSVMRNHFHAVVGFDGYVDVDRMLSDMKGYASRKLNQVNGKREWWTRDGSKRMQRDDRMLENAINYVLYKQKYALVRWSGDLGYLGS